MRHHPMPHYEFCRQLDDEPLCRCPDCRGLLEPQPTLAGEVVRCTDCRTRWEVAALDPTVEAGTALRAYRPAQTSGRGSV